MTGAGGGVFAPAVPTPTPAEALAILRRRFRQAQVPPRGYVRGRTRLRDAIAEESGCSLSRAELLVDHLERKRRIRYTGSARVAQVEPPERWII
jgi:hypothetical protein